MVKRKKENTRRQFSEAVDPRFNVLFNSGSIETEKNSTNSVPTNVSEDRQRNDNSGFKTFVAAKLSDYLDKNMKEVDRPVVENVIFRNRIEGINLFSDSEIITELQPEVPVRQAKKKKHKKNKSFEKESLKDVVVTIAGLQRQAQILNNS